MDVLKTITDYTLMVKNCVNPCIMDEDFTNPFVKDYYYGKEVSVTTSFRRINRKILSNLNTLLQAWEIRTSKRKFQTFIPITDMTEYCHRRYDGNANEEEHLICLF